MSSKNPLFPVSKDALVNDLVGKINHLSANRERLGIPESKMATLEDKKLELITLHAKASNKETRTKLDIVARDALLVEIKKMLRKDIDYYVVDSEAATKVDYDALNVPGYGHHSPLPAPGHVPGVGHITSADLAVTAPFFDAQTGHHGKPDGVYALEAYYRLGGDPPADITGMTEKALDTASPLRIQFDFADEFKIVYLAFRWVGTRGDYGPWSEIHKIGIAR